jgi:hypothetical protein
MTTTTTSPVLRVLPATPEVHFAARLAHYTDVSDVHAALDSGDPGFTLVDSRGDDAWAQAHVPGRSTCRPRGSPSRPRGFSTLPCRWSPTAGARL